MSDDDWKSLLGLETSEEKWRRLLAESIRDPMLPALSDPDPGKGSWHRTEEKTFIKENKIHSKDLSPPKIKPFSMDEPHEVHDFDRHRLQQPQESYKFDENSFLRGIYQSDSSCDARPPEPYVGRNSLSMKQSLLELPHDASSSKGIDYDLLGLKRPAIGMKSLKESDFNFFNFLHDSKPKVDLPLTDVVETLDSAMRDMPLTGKELVRAVAYVARELQSGRTVLPNQVNRLAVEAYIAAKGPAR